MASPLLHTPSQRAWLKPRPWLGIGLVSASPSPLSSPPSSPPPPLRLRTRRPCTRGRPTLTLVVHPTASPSTLDPTHYHPHCRRRRSPPLPPRRGPWPTMGPWPTHCESSETGVRSLSQNHAQNARQERDFKIFFASGGAARAAGAMVRTPPPQPNRLRAGWPSECD